MTVSVKCPSCDKNLRVKEAIRGRRVKCPACGGGLAIPTEEDPRPGPPQAKRVAPLAYLAFFLGAATVIFFFLGPLTLWVGCRALRQIEDDPDHLVGKGRAYLGIFWGTIGTLVLAFAGVMILVQILRPH